ncbi:uncharacterized protein DFL_008049 [Arthrobotrys flagrans]|uniref:HD domain-containing protein n=1 Tax=Arthrobotrys flagrans TaxID=97331 RepID=A0A436ZMN7_ARTFL|nr:hypothetical protein DFL_008049 [Arthrobotrys flagrans]
MSLLAKYAFLHRYLEFLQSCGVPDPGQYTQPMGDAYREPHRAYHNTAHITFMLDKLAEDVRTGNVELSDWEQRCIMFAVWWHDFVYNPQAKDNELQSMTAWENFVDQVSQTSSVLEPYKIPVSSLIHCTISHIVLASSLGGPLSPALVSYFLDLDLAILAASRDTYTAYANNIRSEYSNYSIADYRNGRMAVLKSFLGRDKIFLTSSLEGAREKMENMESLARQNVSWEIGELESGRLPQS